MFEINECLAPVSLLSANEISPTHDVRIFVVFPAQSKITEIGSGDGRNSKFFIFRDTERDIVFSKRSKCLFFEPGNISKFKCRRHTLGEYRQKLIQQRHVPLEVRR